MNIDEILKAIKYYYPKNFFHNDNPTIFDFIYTPYRC